MVFIPTYLYIKQHTKTGKLYFGKTSKSLDYLLSYTGSGKYWKHHLKQHGKKYVTTLWYHLYDNIFDLVADALSMSKSFDIVNSNSWLNLIIENGLDGGDVSSGTRQYINSTGTIKRFKTGDSPTNYIPYASCNNKIWVTNGYVRKRVPEDKIPEGFVKSGQTTDYIFIINKSMQRKRIHKMEPIPYGYEKENYTTITNGKDKIRFCTNFGRIPPNDWVTFSGASGKMWLNDGITEIMVNKDFIHGPEFKRGRLKANQRS